MYMCWLTCTWSLVDKRDGIHGPHCALFEGVGISFPGVHLNVIAFRQLSTMCVNSGYSVLVCFQTQKWFPYFLYVALHTTMVLRKRNVY